MKRDDLEHVLRAAGAITGVSSWVIVGQEFVRLLIQLGIVSRDEILTRLNEVDEVTAVRIRGRLRALPGLPA